MEYEAMTNAEARARLIALEARVTDLEALASEPDLPVMVEPVTAEPDKATPEPAAPA